ncbi:MAG: metallophosphoesterase [Thermostichales cyanobacterium BF4_bins_65]
MRILIGSDYHCQAKLQVEALDLLPGVDAYINCGDFCSLAGAKHPDPHLGYHPKGQREVEQLQSFLQEVDERGKPWLFIPGNHDPLEIALAPLAGRHGYMGTRSESLMWQGLHLLIVPWTPPCGWNWSLTRTHLQELLEQWQGIPPVDLLISHAPPLGMLDENSRWYGRKTPTLRPLVEQIQPRYYLCGHMHHDGGKQGQIGKTTVINAALHNMILELPPYVASQSAH